MNLVTCVRVAPPWRTRLVAATAEVEAATVERRRFLVEGDFVVDADPEAEPLSCAVGVSSFPSG